MSTKGVYTALSGAMAQNLRLDTIANNIANVNTPAFKRDQQLFREYLTANEKPPEVIQVPKIPASIESFYDMQGGDKSFAEANGTYTDYSQGGIKLTGNPLDVAVENKGFFEVATPSGVKLTRNGAFSIDGQGQLVTKDGMPVMLNVPGATDPAERVLRLEPGTPININDVGEVFSGDQSLGRLSIVDVANPDTLEKMGSSLYGFKANSTPDIRQVDRPQVKQGHLETSNVNIVKEMTDMITATRVFESAQKAINAYDSMNDKLVNSVPKVG